MEISKNIEIINVGLYLNNSKTFIIGDIHLGYEGALQEKGMLIPSNFEKIKKRIMNMLKGINVKTIIINGDLKHNFGTINKNEWSHTIKLLDLLLKKYEIILIKGNHDLVLNSIASKRNLKIVEEYQIEDILICHGHKIPNTITAKTIIIGHEHPAISFKFGVRKEKYKCFLKGKYKKHSLIVIPSFIDFYEGTDILQGNFLSPFLTKLDNFEIYVIQDKIYYFGNFKKLKELNREF